MKLNPRDIKITQFRRSRGKGGQHAQKTACAVRMEHLPTGVIAEACTERSLQNNLQLAYKHLVAKLARRQAEAKAKSRRERRDAQPDAAFGGAQVRTYHFPDQYVLDHRTGHTGTPHNVVKRGKLEGFIRAFLTHGFATRF